MTQVLLATDIGTDVDDALALALLIAEPDVDLVGVTTVYGHAALLPGGGRCRTLRDRAVSWAARREDRDRTMMERRNGEG